MSYPYKSSPQKTTHHVVAVGVFFGLIKPNMKILIIFINLQNYVFPQEQQFRVFSHSKRFGAELISDSLWLSGPDPSWGTKRSKRFCGRFRGRFRGKFRQGSTKVSPKSHQGPTKVLQVSLCVWFSEGGSVLGCQKVPWKVPPRFRGKFRGKFHAAEWSLIGFHLKIHRCCWGYSLGLFFKSIWE